MRIRNADADVLGAGILVCGGQVLTCAHVISPDIGATPPTTRVIVEFVGLRGTPPAGAAVSARCWVPAYDGVWGDVTLLELDRDRRAGLPEAPLRRQLVTGSHVWICGYPAEAELLGVLAQAVVAGHCAGERVQLDSRTPDNPVSRGFSGAGVSTGRPMPVPPVGNVDLALDVAAEPGPSWRPILRRLLPQAVASSRARYSEAGGEHDDSGQWYLGKR